MHCQPTDALSAHRYTVSPQMHCQPTDALSPSVSETGVCSGADDGFIIVVAVVPMMDDNFAYLLVDHASGEVSANCPVPTYQ